MLCHSKANETNGFFLFDIVSLPKFSHRLSQVCSSAQPYQNLGWRAEKPSTPMISRPVVFGSSRKIGRASAEPLCIGHYKSCTRQVTLVYASNRDTTDVIACRTRSRKRSTQ